MPEAPGRFRDPGATFSTSRVLEAAHRCLRLDEKFFGRLSGSSLNGEINPFQAFDHLVRCEPIRHHLDSADVTLDVTPCP